MERSNFIDIQQQVTTLNGLLSTHATNVENAVLAYTKLAAASKVALPSEFVKTAKEVDDISTKLAGTLKRQAQVQSALNRQLATEYAAAQKKVQLDKANLSLTEQKRRASERATKQLERERQALERSNNAYNRVSALMRQATAEYNNLATRKNFGIALTEKENARYLQLQTRIERFNGVLKKTDADIGKFSRNVGNYGTQWDGLRFQTNQLIREIPAMAYGANVFFGAIGNNLPMFVDEVQKARAEQKLAIEQGKQAPGVLSRITGALFNWQTALVLGLTYLTLHGKELSKWIGNLNAGSKSLAELKKNQDLFNQSKIDGLKESQRDRQELESLQFVLKSTTSTVQEKEIALKELRSKFGFYLQGVEDAKILNGDFEESLNEINTALDKQAEKEKALESNLKIRQDMVSINSDIEKTETKIAELKDKHGKEIAKQQKQNKQDLDILSNSTREYSDIYRTTAVSNRKEAGELAKEEHALNKLKKDYIEYQKQINDNNAKIYQLEAETIGLRWQEDKANKSRKQSTYDYIDALASQYELMKAIYESNIAFNNAISEDESKSYEKRGEALKKMYEDQIALAELNKTEQIRILTEQRKEEEALLNKSGLNPLEKDSQQKEINQKYTNELGKVNLEYADSIKAVNAEMEKQIDLMIKESWHYQKAMNDINEAEQRNNQKSVNMFSELQFGELTKGFEKYQKDQTRIQREAEQERLQLTIDNITYEMSFHEDKSDKRVELEAKLQEEKKKLFDLTKKQLEEEKRLLMQLEQQYRRFMDSYTGDVLGQIPALQEMISEGFQDMIQGLIDNDKIGEAMATVAIQTTEIFQEMYNQMAQMSLARYEREYEILEQQRDIAIKFAGESAVAREEIERQYEERQREIRRRQAKEEKELAIFNAIINTAQGVAAALAKANIPLSVLVGALGLAQIAMIRAQPLPAFAEGGQHGGGMMLVNDAKGSNYKETVVTPDGKVMQPNKRNTIMDAPKGTMIYTQKQWNGILNNILLDKGIAPVSTIQNNGLTKQDLMDVFSGNNNPPLNVNIDRHGFKVMQEENGKRVNKLNSRIRIKNLRNGK